MDINTDSDNSNNENESDSESEIFIKSKNKKDELSIYRNEDIEEVFILIFIYLIKELLLIF